MEEYIAKDGYLYVSKTDKNVVGKKLMTGNIDLFELVEKEKALSEMDKIEIENI